MHRYRIFLITGETVDVLAASVKVMTDTHGQVNRYDFLDRSDAPICMIQPVAVFYCEYIIGWVELPESEDKS